MNTAPGPTELLAELLAARILHDLGSPMASFSAILPQAADADARDILIETAAELRARMRLFALAFGTGDETPWNALPTLLQGAPMAHRVRFEWPPSANILTPGRARLILSAALLAAEALPRGGIVRIGQAADGTVELLPQGRDAAWSPSFVALMAGGSLAAALAEGPRRVLAPWVVVQAGAEAVMLDFALAAGTAIPPLVLTPAA